MAVVEFSVGGLEAIVVEEVAVVNGDDLAGAAGGEVNHGSTVRDHGAVSINEGHGCVGYVVPARTEGPSVSGKNEMVGLEGGTEFVLSEDFAVGAGDGFDGTWFERDLIGDGAGVGVEFLCAEGFIVEEELDLFGVGVDFEIFGMGRLVFGGPVEEKWLTEARSGIEWGIRCSCCGLIVGGG